MVAVAAAAAGGANPPLPRNRTSSFVRRSSGRSVGRCLRHYAYVIAETVMGICREGEGERETPGRDGSAREQPRESIHLFPSNIGNDVAFVWRSAECGVEPPSSRVLNGYFIRK